MRADVSRPAGQRRQARHGSRELSAVPRQRPHARGQLAGGFGQFIRTSTCSVCRGQGTIVREPCETCRGTGRTRATRTVKVEVPAGIAHGQRLRLTGEGGAGGPGRPPRRPLRAPGCGPHQQFVRDGDDLVYRLDLTMVDAALGSKRSCRRSTATSSSSCRPAAQPGDVKVFRNRGVPVLQGYGRGDLRVVLNVTCRGT